MEIPEGINTVSIEGGDLAKAISAAASELGIEENRVAHKIDLSHFRSATGASKPMTTVKIIAWQSESEVRSFKAPPARERSASEGKETRERSDRGDRRGKGRDRDRGDRGDRGDRRGRGRDRGDRGDRGTRLRGAEEGTTEASDFAAAWFNTLIGFMDVEGEITGTGSDERIHLSVKANKAGRIIGKRGATLGAIRHLLSIAIKNAYGELTIDVDIDDDRPRESRSDRDQDDRGRGRNRGRGRGRRGGEESGRYPEEKLKALATRAAEKARETGQTITINLELNSYDRRIVHMAVSEIEGVGSQSEERSAPDADGKDVVTKFIQVLPE